MENNLETQVEEVAEQTTQDVIAAEFAKLEQPEEKPDEGVVRVRDDSGKFAKKPEEDNPEEKPEEKAEEHEEPKPEEVKPARNPYASWKKEAQAELSKLPETVQQMIQERETQFHKGIQQYKEDAVYGKQLKGALSQFDPYLTELGVTASQALPSLLNAERTLRKGNAQEKTQMIMQLMHDYGVDANSLAQTHFNPVEYQLRQQLAQLQGQVAGISQSRQMAEEANLGQTIEQFADGKEYFEDVRGTMADLLDRGLAKDLDDAYTKALRLNDDVFGKWQASQHANTDRQRLEQANQAAKAAKASAVSVKGSPTGVTRAPEPKTTEEAVRQAMAASGLI